MPTSNNYSYCTDSSNWWTTSTYTVSSDACNISSSYFPNSWMENIFSSKENFEAYIREIVAPFLDSFINAKLEEKGFIIGQIPPSSENIEKFIEDNV